MKKAVLAASVLGVVATPFAGMAAIAAPGGNATAASPIASSQVWNVEFSAGGWPGGSTNNRLLELARASMNQYPSCVEVKYRFDQAMNWDGKEWKFYPYALVDAFCSKVKVDILLDGGLTSAQRSAIAKELAQDPLVKSVSASEDGFKAKVVDPKQAQGLVAKYGIWPGVQSVAIFPDEPRRGDSQ